MSEKNMRLIVGLGNPGLEYALHRHNVGYMVTDALLDEDHNGFWGPSSGALLTPTLMLGRFHALMKPTTFMNSSGEAVKKVSQRLEIPIHRIIVIHDDLDLPLGTLRIKVGGGDGGHRGIRSVAKELDTKEFARVRLGVGRPPEGVEVLNYVLSSFLPEEKDRLREMIQQAKKAVEMIISDGVQSAQNALNGIRRKEDVQE